MHVRTAAGIIVFVVIVAAPAGSRGALRGPGLRRRAAAIAAAAGACRAAAAVVAAAVGKLIVVVAEATLASPPTCHRLAPVAAAAAIVVVVSQGRGEAAAPPRRLQALLARAVAVARLPLLHRVIDAHLQPRSSGAAGAQHQGASPAVCSSAAGLP